EADIVRVIESPAKATGLFIEQGLSTIIARDVVGTSTPLPLLQFTLSALFERRAQDRMTFSAYQDIGGVNGALVNHAEAIVSAMSLKEQTLTQRLLFRLIDLPDNGRPVRRRVIQPTLLSAFVEERADIERILDRLYRGRLVTYDNDPQTRLPTVEIVHEALLQEWHRLGEWIEAARETLQTHRRLQIAVGEWETGNQHESFLASGTRLAQLEMLSRSPYIRLTSDEQRYLDASVRLRQRARQRRQMVIATLAGALVIALLLMGVALVQREEAIEQRNRADEAAAIARSRELAASAQAQLLTSPHEALSASLLAFDSADTQEARNALLLSITRYPFVQHYHDTGQPITAMTANGDQIAYAHADGTVIIDGQTQTTSHEGRVYDIARRSDTVITAGADGIALVWQGNDIPTELIHTAPVWSVALHPSEPLAVSGDADGNLTLWDLVSGDPIRTWSNTHTDIIHGVTFSPDGATFASAGADQRLFIWSTDESAPLQRLEGHTNWVLAATYSPNGQVVASAGVTGIVRFWDVNTGAQVFQVDTAHSGWVRDIAFDETGRRLVTASQDGTLIVWDTVNNQHLYTPLTAHAEAIWDVAWDGEALISGSEDGLMITWNLSRPNPLILQENFIAGEVISGHASSDGTLVLLSQVESDTALTLMNGITGDIRQSWP
ncbi:MAG: WD40 repeat domain-containing protein, partial [Chloroflexota bacterium]